MRLPCPEDEREKIFETRSKWNFSVLSVPSCLIYALGRLRYSKSLR
jgi:hypothetical protein